MTSTFSVPIQLGKYNLSIGPKTFIVLFGLLLRITVHLILWLLGNVIPLFDTSPLLTSTSITGTGIGPRWDSIHFISIALDGYKYEQQLAFQPLHPILLRLVAHGVKLFRSTLTADPGSSDVRYDELSVDDIVWAGMILGNGAYLGAALVLYKLTSHLFPHRQFSLVTTIFYLIPPTPAIPGAGYTEPFFALCTFSGLYLLITKKQYVLSSGCFALATGVRATGVLAVGLVGWFSLLDGIDLNMGRASFRRFLQRILIRIPQAVLPCLITILPFIAFQTYAYMAFCLLPNSTDVNLSDISPLSSRPWCEHRLPLAYTFVQGEYWNVGFLKYWTLAQLPNILLALPVLAISLYGSSTYLFSLITSITKEKSKIKTKTNVIYSHPALLPLHLYSILMTLLLLCNSHTQIALRVSLTDPVIWWNISSLAVNWSGQDTEKPGSEDKKKEMLKSNLTILGKCWITWTLIWGSISLVLWAGHYPPA